jgi:hypothetical protein
LAILSFSLVLLGYSFWLSHLFGQISAQSHSNRFFPLPHLKSIVGTSFNTLTSTFAKDTIAPVWFTAVITLFLLFLLLYLAMLSSWAGKFLCLTGLLPPLVLLFQSFYTGRGLYTVRLLTSTQLIWVVALAYAISLCSNLMHRRVLIISAVACAVTFCVLNWSTIGPSAKPGVKGAVSHILANRSEDEPILTRTEFVFFAAHYYAYACTNVQLCSKERSRFAFSFSAHLRNEDLITIDEVRKLKCRGVWFISSKSYNSMSQLYFEVPQHWKRDINLEFSQGDYSWEVHPVTVEHYVIDNSPRE